MSPDTCLRVREIFARHLEVPVDKVELDARLEDLGIDSLAALELLFEIEEEFKVRVPNERATEFATVRALCEGIESLRQAGAAS